MFNFTSYAEPGFNSQWYTYKVGEIWPIESVVAGSYNEGGANSKMYIARRDHQESSVIGYAYVNAPFFFGWHGKELSYDNYQVFIELSERRPQLGRQ